MATAYNVFDTTPASLFTDLATKITASTDWADVTPTWSTTTTAGTTTSQTAAWTVSSTTGMYVGMHIAITVTGVTYYRRVTAVTSGTQFNISSSLGVATSTGQTISLSGKVFKATTTRGAQMAFSIGYSQGSNSGATFPGYVSVQFFRTYTGTTPADFVDSTNPHFVYFSSGAILSGSNPLHAICSAGKEHFYLTLEGPRNNETGTDSTTYGSFRNVMFMCDVVPYHAADTTPCVAAYARFTASVDGDPTSDTVVEVSRDSVNGSSWVQAKLATLSWPGALWSGQLPKFQRRCTIDGNEYLWPYVVIQDGEGLRGRLAKFFYAGFNSYTSTFAIEPGENIGDVVTYGSTDYKLVAPNKASAASNQESYSPLACVSGTSGANSGTSPVVAIPVT